MEYYFNVKLNIFSFILKIKIILTMEIFTSFLAILLYFIPLLKGIEKAYTDIPAYLLLAFIPVINWVVFIDGDGPFGG